MTTEVARLDDRRPRVSEWMVCLFCGAKHVLRHIVTPRLEYFGPCPGCDEEASVPEWRMESTR